MQAVGADEQIPLGRTAAFELKPHPVVRVDHADRTGPAPDAISREAVQQPVEQDPARHHPPGGSASTIAVTSIVASVRPVDVAPVRWTALTGAIHVDAQLAKNRRAVGPDGHGTTTRLRPRPLLEDGDVVAVAHQSPGDEMPPTPAPTTRIRSGARESAFGTATTTPHVDCHVTLHSNLHLFVAPKTGSAGGRVALAGRRCGAAFAANSTSSCAGGARMRCTTQWPAGHGLG